jgi:glutamate racemase
MSPIGVFDSGYGGLTVLKELVKQLPQYDYLYLGDNARAPYGTRSFETVYKYTLECVQWLINQGCPLIILACNTASAKALRTIQQNDLDKINPDVRVLGVIRPTAEVIGNYSTIKTYWNTSNKRNSRFPILST